MVGKLTAGEVRGRALINLRQHGRVPVIPFRRNPVIYVLPPSLQIGPLHGVVGDVEKKCVVEDLQILIVAVSRSTLLVGLITPEQLALKRGRVLSERWQQVDAVRRICRVGG